MAKKKTEEKEEKEDFDLLTALEDVNPFMREGFKEFVWFKGVKSQKEFDKYLKEYGG